MKQKIRKREFQRPALDFAIDANLIGEGLTQSEMQTWDNCPEKWYLRYNLMLKKKGEFSWATTYGTWMHSFLEEFYSTKGKRYSFNPELRDRRIMTQQQLVDYEYWSQLLEIQGRTYASYYKHDFKLFKVKHVEVVADLRFRGVRLKGKIDLFLESLAHGGFYTWDHKTTSRIDKSTVLGWDFRFQFMFYCWLAWKLWPEHKVRGFFINAIRKPQIKRGEHESVKAFLQRVQSDMLVRPEFYFYRDRLRLKKGDLQHFEDTILIPKLERIKMLFDPKIPDEVKMMLVRNKNTDHCVAYNSPCQFMNACKNGLELEQEFFYRRKAKHEELELEFHAD